jgi:hypothetical protein
MKQFCQIISQSLMAKIYKYSINRLGILILHLKKVLKHDNATYKFKNLDSWYTCLMFMVSTFLVDDNINSWKY